MQKQGKMDKNLQLLIIKRQVKTKKDVLEANIELLEELILSRNAELEVQKAISNASGIEREEYEIDLHLQNVDYLNNFNNLLRAQMLVSICGLFEFYLKNALNIAQAGTIGEREGLSDVIVKISSIKGGLQLISSKELNTLNEYKEIRNICVHSNGRSKDKNKKIESAVSILRGVEIEHHKSFSKGKGNIIFTKEFLEAAHSIHFVLIDKVISSLINSSDSVVSD